MAGVCVVSLGEECVACLSDAPMKEAASDVFAGDEDAAVPAAAAAAEADAEEEEG